MRRVRTNMSIEVRVIGLRAVLDHVQYRSMIIASVFRNTPEVSLSALSHHVITDLKAKSF